MESQIKNNTDNLPTAYSQIVSSIVSNYDVTFIFYQVKAERIAPDNVTDYRGVQEEVMRIVMPHKSVIELKEVLNKQFDEGDKVKDTKS